MTEEKIIRKNFTMTQLIPDITEQMAEGNIGAMMILMKMFSEDDDKKFIKPIMTMFNLDDMNIRGEQLYVAVNRFCGGDIEKLVQHAKNRSQEMVDYINDELPDHPERAVVRGASFERK